MCLSILPVRPIHISNMASPNFFENCPTPQLAATRCNTLQRTSTHCSTLTHCNTQHHTASHRTGRRRLIGCLKLHIIFCERATNYRALLRKMTNEDKLSLYANKHIDTHKYTDNDRDTRKRAINYTPASTQTNTLTQSNTPTQSNTLTTIQG